MATFDEQKSFYDADIAGIEGEMPLVVEFEGVALIGQRTPTIATLDGDLAGMVQGYDLEISMRVKAFEDLGLEVAKEKDTLAVDGVNYTIEKAVTDQPGVEISYTLKAQN